MTPTPARKRRVTLADIAEACGVSTATVSLVLSGSPRVNAGTRARVETELGRQGYVYNRSAANLRRQTSTTVALVINDLSNPFFAEFAAGVDEALAGAGYVALLGGTGESVARQEEVFSSLMEYAPAGVILSPAGGTDGRRLRRIAGAHTPVLVFNREVADAPWDHLICDNRYGAYLATAHLLAQGHRRIAFFGGYAGSSSCRARRQGYRDALTTAGVTPRPQWMIECLSARLAAAAAAPALLAATPAPTAVVCYNDAVALGLMHALAAKGLRIGRDVSVTGFDDIPEAAVTTPALTTIAAAPRELGRRAAAMLLQRRADVRAPSRRVVAPVALVPRASTAPPPEPGA